MQDFRKLLVWQKAREFSLLIEKIANQIRTKKPRLASQLERAADAIAALIAEGRGRATDADFAHYTSMAIGTTTESENHLIRAYDGGLIGEADFETLCARAIEIRRMLIGLRKALRGNPRPRNKDTPPPLEAR